MGMLEEMADAFQVAIALLTVRPMQVVTANATPGTGNTMECTALFARQARSQWVAVASQLVESTKSSIPRQADVSAFLATDYMREFATVVHATSSSSTGTALRAPFLLSTIHRTEFACAESE